MTLPFSFWLQSSQLLILLYWQLSLVLVEIKKDNVIYILLLHTE